MKHLLLVLLLLSNPALARDGIQLEKTLTTTNAVTTTTSDAYDVRDSRSFSVQSVIDVNTPAAKTAVDTAFNVTTNVITVATHGFTTGLKVGVASDATLPDPLTATDYYVISVTSGTIKLATSLADALAGTAVDIIDQGSAAQVTTFTPTSLAGGSIKLQKSNDGLTWSDEGSATSVTADATVWLEKMDPTAKYMRVWFTLTAGRLSAATYVLGKGPR